MMMRTILLMMTLLTNVICYAGDTKKLKVIADAYTEAGESADKALGSEKSQILKVISSDKNNKYARSTYLKFRIPKGQVDVESATLSIKIKVYKVEKSPDKKYNISVYAVDDDRWNELTITHNNAPEKGVLLGKEKFPQAEDKKSPAIWKEIELDAPKINQLFDGKKDKNISLILRNDEPNGIGAQILSKERKWSNGNSAQAGALLIIK